MKKTFSHIEPTHINELLAAKTNFFPVPEKLDSCIFPFLYGIIDHPRIKDFVSRPLPTGYLAMFIHFGSEIELFNHSFKEPKTHNCFITGVHTLNKLSYLHASKKIENLVITFKPGGFSRIFNRSAFDLLNRVVDLDELVSSDVMNKLHNLTQTAAIEERIAKLNDLLIFLLENSTFSSRKSHIEVLEYIHQSNGNISLNDIGEITQVTPRTIERSFQVNVGISPKEYIRIVRFNSIFRFLLENRFEDWSDIVHRFGYFDQSHFIHDFKAVTGFTPGGFLAFREHGMIYLDRFQIVYQIEDLRLRHRL
ncbi:MAG: helix-turn-helix transcriptional regulator [Bacteroidales bacterium]